MTLASAKTMPAKTVYFVVGQQNSGKSATIQALTGVKRIRTGMEWSVSFGGIVRHCFVQTGSPQENPATHRNIPAIAASGVPYDCVICALQDVHRTRPPKDSVDTFVGNGWAVGGLAVIGAVPAWMGTPPYSSYPQFVITSQALLPGNLPWPPHSAAPNAMAATLRAAWGID